MCANKVLEEAVDPKVMREAVVKSGVHFEQEQAHQVLAQEPWHTRKAPALPPGTDRHVPWA